MPSLSRLALLLAALFLTSAASAQTGIGAQLGDPTGVSLKFGAGSGSVALAAGWDLGDGDDQLSLEGHYFLRETRIPGDADLALFYGPGVFVQARENSDTAFGASFGIGLSLYATRDIEIYGLVSPRLQLIDETDFDLGGGIGGLVYL
ncbi:MAG TPA: hypothetical protein EYQ24_06110 [Bacteroidetes bacterium]|nr:hypothetical protein [Bacteroidota bacterium]